jgi:hypothetical protein
LLKTLVCKEHTLILHPSQVLHRETCFLMNVAAPLVLANYLLVLGKYSTLSLTPLLEVEEQLQVQKSRGPEGRVLLLQLAMKEALLDKVEG